SPSAARWPRACAARPGRRLPRDAWAVRSKAASSSFDPIADALDGVGQRVVRFALLDQHVGVLLAEGFYVGEMSRRAGLDVLPLQVDRRPEREHDRAHDAQLGPRSDDGV